MPFVRVACSPDTLHLPQGLYSFCVPVCSATPACRTPGDQAWPPGGNPGVGPIRRGAPRRGTAATRPRRSGPGGARPGPLDDRLGEPDRARDPPPRSARRSSTSRRGRGNTPSVLWRYLDLYV